MFMSFFGYFVKLFFKFNHIIFHFKDLFFFGVANTFDFDDSVFKYFIRFL